MSRQVSVPNGRNVRGRRSGVSFVQSEVARKEVIARNRIAFAVLYRDVRPIVGDELPGALDCRFQCAISSTLGFFVHDLVPRASPPPQTTLVHLVVSRAKNGASVSGEGSLQTPRILDHAAESPVIRASTSQLGHHRTKFARRSGGG